MANQPKSYRKFLAGSVTAALVASAVAPAASAAENSFPDVPADDVHADNIAKAVEMGLINGFDDGTFGPYQDISRGQVAKIIARHLGEVDTTGVEQFTDVATSGDTELHEAALTVRAANVFTGRDGELDFEENITREEMASVIVRVFDHLVDLEDAESSVTDVETAFPVHQDNIKLLSEWGITNVDVFNPKGDLQRAQFVSFMIRAIESMDVEVPVVEEVSAIDAMTISVTFDNGEVVEVALDEALVEGENEVTFEVDGVEYTATVTYDVAHTSGVSGFILNGSTPVKDATVTVNGQSTTTNAKGYYELLDVAPGTQEVTVEAEGFQTVTVSDVKVMEKMVSSLTKDISSVLINTANIQVSGMVVDSETGASINDATTVTLESYDAETDTWNEVASVNTNSGAYTITQADASPDFKLGAEYRQTVSMAGYHDFEQMITLDNQEVVNSLAGIELDDVEAIDVTGKITDATGANVGDTTTVEIYNAAGDLVGNTTTVGGTYSLTDLQLMSGTYNVVVDDGTSAVSYTEFEVTEGADATHNVKLQEGNTVNATIGTESLSDVFGADASDADDAVYTLELLSGNTVIKTSTDTGTALADEATLGFSFDRIAPGSYTVKISGDYVQTEEFALTVDGDETLEERAVPAGLVTGNVTDSTPTSLEDAMVNLLDTDGKVVATTKTDASGDYKFGGVVAGDYTVSVSKADFVTEESAEFTVAKNTASTTDVSLEDVVTTGDVAGFVRVKGSLAPVSGATVVYYDEDGEEVYNTTVGADGSYSLSTIAAGTYEVVVRNAGVETFTTTQEVKAGDDLKSVNYNLTNGGNAALEISVVDSEGNPVDAAVNGFDLSDAYVDPTLTSAGIGYWELDTAPTDTVTFTDLSAGTYELTIDVLDPAYVDIDTTASVAMGETGELEIVVEEVAAQSAVNFRVVDETNTDVTDGTVVVFNEDGSIKTVIASDDSLALVDGNYKLAVYKNGYVVAKRDVTVAGKAVTVPVIQLTPTK
jgi:hypothetical protein